MHSLVVGYGNDLRSDDGAGRVVADRIEAMSLPGVRVRSVSQLTPELALEVAGTDIVVFVDASIDVATTTVSPVEPDVGDSPAITHYAEPAALLGMTRTVGRPPAKAFTVSIPVADLSLGMELSPITDIGVEQAIDIVTRLLSE